VSTGSTALRRLRKGGSSAAPVPVPTTSSPEQPALERCEMCGTAIGDTHSHVVHLERRSLLCTCRPCALLFTERGAGRGRYRAVPNRILRDPRFIMTEVQWDELRIPVRMAFFFLNSDLGRPLAFYPSPAGATESLLSMDTWRGEDGGGLGGTALATTMEPDVEALLIHKLPQRQSECLLVPIDVCYELVGLVRTYWKGFGGGNEVWERIDAFFSNLNSRARELRF
jgi:hypothetical protein